MRRKTISFKYGVHWIRGGGHMPVGLRWCEDRRRHFVFFHRGVRVLRIGRLIIDY